MLLLQCPKCGEFAVAPLPVYRVSDQLTHGCLVCDSTLKALFVDDDAADYLRRMSRRDQPVGNA
jgi:hypothetical protein